MLTVSGLKNFYFLPHFHDMRCGYARIMEIIRTNYHRDPYKGDVFFLCRRMNAVFACSCTRSILSMFTPALLLRGIAL